MCLEARELTVLPKLTSWIKGRSKKEGMGRGSEKAGSRGRAVAVLGKNIWGEEGLAPHHLGGNNG